MSETLLIWLFAGTWAIFGGWCLWLSKFCYDQSYKHNEVRLALLAISKRAAELLHRDDDMYKLDKLVEKYGEQEDLTYEEWKELFDKCDAVLNDPTLSKGDRVAALLLQQLATLSKSYARHKMNPMFLRRKD